MLTCFNDADSRLRYYACEALYNIVKVARGAVLPHFNVLFDGLSKVTAPPSGWAKLGTHTHSQLDLLEFDVLRCAHLLASGWLSPLARRCALSFESNYF